MINLHFWFITKTGDCFLDELLLEHNLELLVWQVVQWDNWTKTMVLQCDSSSCCVQCQNWISIIRKSIRLYGIALGFPPFFCLTGSTPSHSPFPLRTRSTRSLPYSTLFLRVWTTSRPCKTQSLNAFIEHYQLFATLNPAFKMITVKRSITLYI